MPNKFSMTAWIWCFTLPAMASSPPRRPPCEIEAPLRDGRRVCLRTIRPSDEERIRDGIAAMSDRARYLRFFSAFRAPPDSVIKRLSAVDGHDHIGWGAILLDDAEFPPIAAAHAIRFDDRPACAELAIAVLDDYQGLGVARMLIAAVMADCIDEGVSSLEMQVLGENRPAIALVLGLGAEVTAMNGSVSTYALDVAKSLERLRAAEVPDGLKLVMAAL
jgi:GNAT superfamily N-acetyltransferase